MCKELLLQTETSEETPKKKRKEDDEELYMMYNHLQWEDLVAWDNSQIKSPPPKHMDLLYFSGFFSLRIHSPITHLSTQRKLYHAPPPLNPDISPLCNYCSIFCDSIDSSNDYSDFSDKVSHYKGIQESILKPTNRKLLDSNWENNIIWDTKVNC